MLKHIKEKVPFDVNIFKKFIKENKIVLDKEYVSFIKVNNGITLDENEVLVDVEPYTIEYFYGFCADYYKDITKEYEFLKEDIPQGFLPIAKTITGDIIVLGVKEDSNNNKVYLWLHEESTRDIKTLHFVTDTFSKFIEAIKHIENKENEEDNFKVESVWVSSKFKEKFKHLSED